MYHVTFGRLCKLNGNGVDSLRVVNLSSAGGPSCRLGMLKIKKSFLALHYVDEQHFIQNCPHFWSHRVYKHTNA